MKLIALPCSPTVLRCLAIAHGCTCVLCAVPKRSDGACNDTHPSYHTGPLSMLQRSVQVGKPVGDIGPSTPRAFERIEGMSCAEFGFFDVRDAGTCARAALSLEITDDVSVEESGKRPSGCIVTSKKVKEGMLRFNPTSSKIPCGASRWHCICATSSTTAAPAPSTPSPPSSSVVVIASSTCANQDLYDVMNEDACKQAAEVLGIQEDVELVEFHKHPQGCITTDKNIAGSKLKFNSKPSRTECGANRWSCICATSAAPILTPTQLPTPTPTLKSLPSAPIAASDYLRGCSIGSVKVTSDSSSADIIATVRSNLGVPVCLQAGRYLEPLNFDDLHDVVLEAEDGAWLDGTVPIPDEFFEPDPSIGSGVYKANVSSICSSRGSCLWQLFLGGRAVTDARWPNVYKSFVDDDIAFNFKPTPGSAYTEVGPGSTWMFQDIDAEYGLLKSAALRNLTARVTGALLVMHKFRAKGRKKADGMLGGHEVTFTRVIEHAPGSNSLIYEPHDPEAYEGNSSTWELRSPDKGRFYIANHLSLLDKDDEWYFSPSLQQVWVWPRGGGPPKNATARVHHKMLNIRGCTNLTLKGFQIFAGTAEIFDSSHITIEGARFLYGGAGERMLGAVGTAGSTLHTSKGHHIIIQHCEFAYAEASFLSFRTTKNYIFNNYFHNCCWGGPDGAGAINDKKGGQSIYRRNTIHTVGKGNGIKAGPGGVRADLNLIYNLYYDTDSSNLQIPTGSAKGSISAHNWFLFGWSRNGQRYDGDPAGEYGLTYRVVSFNNNQNFRVKGNYHRILHITALSHGAAKGDASFAKNKWCDPSDMIDRNGRGTLGCPTDILNGNNETIQLNIVLGKTGAKDTDYSDIAGSASLGFRSGVWVARLEENERRDEDAKVVCEQLRDPLSLDFRPREGSLLKDAGVDASDVLEGASRFWQNITESSYYGWPEFVHEILGAEEMSMTPEVADGQPDIGAYESDPDEYWIPGRQLRLSPGTPVPFDTARDVSTTTSLMWLPAADCIQRGCKQLVFLDDIKVCKLKAPKNVCRLKQALDLGSQHTWYVHSAGLRSSPTWSFIVAQNESQLCDRLSNVGHGEGDLVECEEAGGC